MRKASIAVVAAAAAFIGLLTGAPSAKAQFTSPHATKVLGYQDQNGTFHALPRVVPDASTSTDYTGTFVVTFTLSIKSTFPSGTKIYCGATFTAESISETNPLGIDYVEEGVGVASGNTCVVKIPYSWVLSTTGTGVEDYYSGSYSVIALSSSVPTVLEDVGLRVVSGAIVEEGKIPAVGATTPYAIAATL